MLAERSGDPDVERLLEGVAFLTGKIRQKVDDELPEVIHSVASLLFPTTSAPDPGHERDRVHPAAERRA